MNGLMDMKGGSQEFWKEKELDIAELLRTYKTEIHISQCFSSHSA